MHANEEKAPGVVATVNAMPMKSYVLSCGLGARGLFIPASSCRRVCGRCGACGGAGGSEGVREKSCVAYSQGRAQQAAGAFSASTRLPGALVLVHTAVHLFARTPTLACGRPSALLAPAVLAAVLAYPRPSALLAPVALAAVLAYRRPSTLLAVVALAAVLAYPRPSTLLAVVALAAVLAYRRPSTLLAVGTFAAVLAHR